MRGSVATVREDFCIRIILNAALLGPSDPPTKIEGEVSPPRITAPDSHISLSIAERSSCAEGNRS